MRTDKDLLGELQISDDVYYGVQTQRTLNLFTPSKEIISTFPSFIHAMAGIKKSCAIVHYELGLLSKEFKDAIAQACDEMKEGQFDKDLVLDMLSGNDFAPIHMNFNEIIATRANEILTGSKDNTPVSPNSHVNLGQSTCDSTYAAARFALYYEITKIIDSLQTLAKAYHAKAERYKNSVKVSHTCFQDAAPINMGQFLNAPVTFLEKQISKLDEMKIECSEHTIGYTVIGTGLGSFKGFHEKINAVLEKELDIPVFHTKNPVEQIQFADFFLRIQSLFKSTITGISKMARDIRIMSSGPSAGFSEISIAPVQNGSSFFPGKVNPSLAELVNIACYQICGYSVAVDMAVEAGELEVTPWYPVFTVNTLNSARLIYNTVDAFAKKCIATLEVNVELNRHKAEMSLGMATVPSALFGYKTATEVALFAAKNSISIQQAVVEMKLLSKEEAEKYIDPLMLTKVEESSALLYERALEERSIDSNKKQKTI